MSSSQKTLLIGCLLGLACAGGAFVFARYQNRLLAQYGEEPQQLSVAELAEHGFTGNRWVELSELELGPRAVVGAERGMIEAIWIPVFTSGQADRAPISVVLRSEKSRSLEEFGLRLRDRTTFRGAMVDSASGGDGNPRSLLAASYPGQPLAAQIWELDIDFGGPHSSQWVTASQSTAGGLAVFGVICLLGLIGSFFVRRNVPSEPSFNTVAELRF